MHRFLVEIDGESLIDQHKLRTALQSVLQALSHKKHNVGKVTAYARPLERSEQAALDLVWLLTSESEDTARSIAGQTVERHEDRYTHEY